MSSRLFSRQRWSMLSDYPQPRLGRAAMLCSTIASIVAGTLSLSMAMVGAHQLNADFLFWGIILVAIFPALGLLASIGSFISIYFWLAPAVRYAPDTGQKPQLLRIMAPMAVIYITVSTAFTVFRTLFPPQSFGGRPFPLTEESILKFFGWLFYLLAIPFAWWVWSMIRVISRRRAPRWHILATILSWVWPAFLIGQLFTDLAQWWLLHRYSDESSRWFINCYRVLTDLSSVWLIISLLLGIISVLLLSALRFPIGDRKGGILSMMDAKG